MVTKSSWSTSLKVRQEKTDLEVGKVEEDVEDAGKEEDGDAIVDSNDEMEEEFAERRLLCSPSEPSQLARQVHTVRKTRMSRILELILVTLLRVYQS